MNIIRKLACKHTASDGSSELKFVSYHDEKYDVGRMKAVWTTYRCAHCGRTVRKDGIQAKFQSGSKAEAYYDRNQAVMAMARLAQMNGMTVGVKGDDPEWPIVFIDLPTGQVSWHIPAAEMRSPLPEYAGEWDGHALDEKRSRIESFIGLQNDPI